MSTFPADFGLNDLVDLRAAQTVAADLDHGKGQSTLRFDGTPEGVKADNNLRAAWALKGLTEYVERTFGAPEEEDFDTLIPDLMSDLLHLCDAVGVDIDQALYKARDQYEDELRGVM